MNLPAGRTALRQAGLASSIFIHVATAMLTKMSLARTTNWTFSLPKTKLKQFLNIFLLLVIGFGAYSQNPGDVIFNEPKVHEMRLTMPQANYWELLTRFKEQRDTTGITTYIECNMLFDTIFLSSVGLRLKGVGSYTHVGMKKSMKIDIDRFNVGQKLDGLDKINLNNSFMDPTMIREKLYLDFLAENG